MEKQITWPEAPKEDGLPHPCEMLRQSIMNLDSWRQSIEWRQDALDILDAMEGDPLTSTITASQREKLLQVMILPGKDIKPPVANRFFLRTLGAVQDAVTVVRNETKI